jgi:hypothetical protein
MLSRLLLSAMLAAALPAAAQPALPPEVQALLDYHTAACTAAGGTLSLSADPVTRVDLNGDGAEDYAFYSRNLTCSTNPLMFCSDLGCELNVFVDGHQHSLVVLDWRLITDKGRNALRITRSALVANTAQDQTAVLVWSDQAQALVEPD